MKLFQYAVIFNSPTGQSELVVDLSTVLAKDNNQAMLIAARSIPKKFENDLDNCEVVVRPF